MTNKENYINDLNLKQTRFDLPIIKIGDTISIEVKITEGNKERIQTYIGTVLSINNSSINTTITVRKVLQGIAIERIFLIHSPKIHKIQILKSSKVRKSKLYYLRYLSEKAGRLKSF